MKALILAAGRGTRVRPLTDALPKPMIPIVNKPVMEFLVEHLRRFGVDQIMVNTSYLASKIESHFGDGRHFNVEMAYSFEGRVENGRLVDEPLGSAGAIRKIHNHSGFFDDTFIVICGDAIIDLDFDALLAFHRSRKAMATIALREVSEDEVHNYGVVVQNSEGRITDFQEKPSKEQAKSRLVNTGIYVFEPAILETIPAQGAYDIGSELFPKLAAFGGLYGVNLSSPWQWLDIGRIPDFHHVNMQALRGEIDCFKMPGHEERPGVWMGLNVKANLSRCKIVPPVYIGSSAEIQDGAELIGPVVVGAGAVVAAGSRVEESIVMDYTRVGSCGSFKRKIIGPTYCADADGSVLDERHTDTSWLFADARSDTSGLTRDQTLIALMATQVNA